MTPARDEAADIVETMESVIGQSLHPVRRVIVDDGSIDDTSVLVYHRITGLDWITLVRRVSAEQPADFVSKVLAVRAGVGALDDIEYDFIGTLDADIALEVDCFQKLFRASRSAPASALRADT